MKNLTFKQKLWVYLVAFIVIVLIAQLIFHNAFAGIVVFTLGYFLYTRTIEPYEGSSESQDDSIIDVEVVNEEDVVEDEEKEDEEEKE